MDPTSRPLYEGRTHEDIRRQHALDGLGKGEIYSTIGEQELEATLVELYRSARSSLEEGGANTHSLAQLENWSIPPPASAIIPQ